jgi:hypothetical protein
VSLRTVQDVLAAGGVGTLKEVHFVLFDDSAVAAWRAAAAELGLPEAGPGEEGKGGEGAAEGEL